MRCTFANENARAIVAQAMLGGAEQAARKYDKLKKREGPIRLQDWNRSAVN